MKKTNHEQIRNKTEFNHHSINHYSNIFQCSNRKCNKRNLVISNDSTCIKWQLCLFCGQPNYIK
jgi:hypothetical protein